MKFSHPIDAIRSGIAYVPGDRSEALAMQRSVRENIALPFSAALRNWGPIPMRRERAKVRQRRCVEVGRALAAIADAFRLQETGGHFGKIVIEF